jgi:hypothetical protein
MSSRRAAEKIELGESECGKCAKGVKGDGVACDVCGIWFHVECAGLDKDEYRLLQSVAKKQKNEKNNIHWFCEGCNIRTLDVMKAMREMQLRTDRLEKEVNGFKVEIGAQMNKLRKELQDGMEDSIKSMDKQNKDVKMELDQMKNEIMDLKKEKPLWTEIVSREVDSRFTEVNKDLDVVQKTVNETRMKMNEDLDKESRLNNIIVYKLPESEADSYTERNNDDKRMIANLMENVLKVGFDEADIKRLLRLGKKPEDGRVRPLLVEFTYRTTKNLIMQNLSHLRSAKDELKGISIAHDMTKKEREECKELVEEAKKKQLDAAQEGHGSGEYIYRVRGAPGHMKIVRLKKY